MPRIALKELLVTNVGPIRKARLSIKPGLTIIRGRNMDATAGKNQTNAVGKSLILSPIAMALSGSRPLPVPKRYQHSGPFTSAGASMGVYLSVDDKPVEIHQRQKGKTYELAVVKSGKDLELRTQKIAQEYRQKLLPVSEAQFYSTVYLDMRRPPVLQTGTDVQRLEFLSDIFQLNQLDQFRKKVLAIQQELNAKKRDFQLIATEHQSVVTQLSHVDWTEDTVSKLAELRNQQEKCSRKVEQWSKRATSSALAKQQRIDRKEARKNLCEHRSTSLIAADIAAAKGAKSFYQVWKYSKAQIAKLKADVVKLPKCPEDDPADLEKQINRLRSQFKPVVLPEKCPTSPVGNKLSEVEYNKYFPLSCIEDSDIAASECPTCGQCVVGLAKKVRIARKKITIHNKHLVYEVELKKYNQLVEQHKINEELKERGLRLVKRLALIREHQNQKRLVETIALLKKKAGPKPTYIGEDLDALRAELAVANKSIRARKILAKPLLKHWPKAEAQHSKALKRLQKLSSHISELEQQQTAYETLVSQKLRLSKKLKEYKELDKEIEAAAKLSKLLGNKGLKLEMAKELLKSLETIMNDKADLLFVEPIRFKFGTNGSSISMCYQHKNSKSWTDIREMSGQESRAFSLLFFCAVRPYIRNFNTDFVVLDEMDANMSKPTRELFAKEFLPYLLTVVPKVLLATPDQETAYSGRTVLLEKRNNNTTIKSVT